MCGDCVFFTVNCRWVRAAFTVVIYLTYKCYIAIVLGGVESLDITGLARFSENIVEINLG